jgi:hypothetical protein
MALLRPRTVTPARLAANRSNAQHSTGPRTERGKAWSRLNALRSGARSGKYDQALEALYTADLGTVDDVAAALLTAEELAHPVFARLVERQRQAHRLMIEYSPEYKAWKRDLRRRRRSKNRN